MEFAEFIRQPFKVEAVQITEENMEAICSLIGTDIVERGGKRHIRIDRKIVPLGTKAEVGSWVTRMGNKLRHYPDRIFKQQFVPMTSEWAGWFDDDDSSLQETVEILSDPETLEAISEAEEEISESNVPEVLDSSGVTSETAGESTSDGPQIGDTYTEPVATSGS